MNNSNINSLKSIGCANLSNMTYNRRQPINECLDTKHPNKLSKRVAEVIIDEFCKLPITPDKVDEEYTDLLFRSVTKLYFRKSSKPKKKLLFNKQQCTIERSLREHFEFYSKSLPYDLELLNEDGDKFPCNCLLMDLVTQSIRDIPKIKYPSNSGAKPIQYSVKNALNISTQMIDICIRNRQFKNKISSTELCKSIVPHTLFYLKKDYKQLEIEDINSLIRSFKFWGKCPALLQNFPKQAGFLAKSITKVYILSTVQNNGGIAKRISDAYNKYFYSWNSILPNDVFIGKSLGRLIPTNLLRLILETPYLELSLKQENSHMTQELIELYTQKSDSVARIILGGVCDQSIEAYTTFLSERSVNIFFTLSLKEIEDLITMSDFFFMGIKNAPASITSAIQYKVMGSSSSTKIMKWFFIYKNLSMDTEANECFQYLMKLLNTPKKIQEFEDEVLQPENKWLLHQMNRNGMFTKLYREIEILDMNYSLEEAVELYLRGLIENNSWVFIAKNNINKHITVKEARHYLEYPQNHPAYRLGLNLEEVKELCREKLNES